MSESFFGLAKRPFAATPDPACFVPIHGTQQALSKLFQCVADGSGIGVLTAPAGLGKSLVCQRLAGDLQGRFSVVYLPTANFPTRRSLLQAILFELGFSFVRMGDQELRLELASMLRRFAPGRQAVVLIVDEAHLLAARMLEELRSLVNFAHAGEPLIRLVVSAQLSLEETLSHPALDAFNQRIGCQVSLESLTQAESVEYVSRRLAWAGANVADIFNSDTLTAICQASDGSPRCLNQLCDHSLLLANGAGERPVSLETIYAALDDLKHLPLSWNRPLSSIHSNASGDDSQLARGEISLPALRSEPDTSPRSIFEIEATDADPDELLGMPKGLLGMSFVEMAGPRGLDASQTAAVEYTVEQFDISEHLEAAEHLDVTDPIAAVQMAVTETGDDGDFNGGFVDEAIEGGQADDWDATLEFGELSLVPGAPAPAAIVEPLMIPVSRVSIRSADDASLVTADEEIVIDRYAALDAAVSRLTRTMINARGMAAAQGPISMNQRKSAAVKPVEEERAGMLVFDVVLPEESSLQTARQDVSPHEPTPHHDLSGAAPKGRSDGRRYEFLFREMRRRRRGA